MNSHKACNLGNYIFPNSTNQFNVPFNPDVERFNNSEPITIRWWNEDTNCGILDVKLIKTNNRCIVGNQYGSIVYFNRYDVKSGNCNIPIENTPLDSIIFMSLSALVLVFGATKLLRTV